MKNKDEEKAREIATWPLQRDGEFQMCYACALEMAQWKQEQMMRKAVEWLEPVFKDLAGYYCGGDLIKDFKKYMEE